MRRDRKLPGEVMNVTLSRPFFAALPRIIPSIDAGILFDRHRGGAGLDHLLSAVEELCDIEAHQPRQEPCRNSKARNSGRRYRDAVKDVAELVALGTCCIFEPGSVIAMKWLPAFSAPIVFFTRSKKYCLKMFGSSVCPTCWRR